ncbi:MAG: hypothetical protein ACM3SQ_09130 [Betaproteobacteria bacterium]
MTEPTPPTVEMSLEMLSEAVGKAADDFRILRGVVDAARADIASRNTTVTRRVTAAVQRAVDHLRETDEALRDVLKGLEERD